MTFPPTVSLAHDDSCPNDDTGILLVNTSCTDDIVFVNDDDDDGSTEREFENLQPGVYEVWVEDILGCRTYSGLIC